jgi:hypothetical protein
VILFEEKKRKKFDMKAVVRIFCLVAVVAGAAFAELLHEEKDLPKYKTMTGGPYTYRFSVAFNLESIVCLISANIWFVT